MAVVSGRGRSPFTLVSGQLPDPSKPDQVLASSTLQQDNGVHVGTVIHVPFEAPSQAADYNNPNTGYVAPHGPRLALQVVGIEASEVEFPSGTTPVYLLYAGPGFARSVLPHTALQYQYFVRLRHGAAGIPQFIQQANQLNLGMGTVGDSSEDGTAATIQASIHPQAVGWWILAALAALVGLAVVGQALARQSAVESEDHPTLVAVGMSGRELFALDMARNLVVGLAGAVGAVVIATALSPIAPLGEARLAEDSTGIAFDSLVLLLGALATVVVVLALGIWPALRAARTRRMNERAGPSRSSAMVRHLVTLGAPPTAVIGVRNALERRSGGSAVPLGSALLGMVLAVIALCATGVFGASLTHLTTTPRLYGDPEQVSFSPPNTALLTSLEHNPAVTAITEGVGAGDVTVNGKIVGGIAGTSVKGPLLFSTVAGTSSGRRRPGRARRLDHAPGGRAHRVGRGHHVHHAFRCAPHRAVPGGLPDLLPAVRGVREPRHGDPDDDGRPHPRRLPPGSPARPVPAEVRRAQPQHRWGQGELRPGPAREGGAWTATWRRTRRSPHSPSPRPPWSTSARRSTSRSSSG